METQEQDLYEMIDLKKIEVYRDLFRRLQHELGLWDQLTNATALLGSQESLHRLGLDGMQPGASDNGSRRVPTQDELERSKGKVLAGLRQTLYRCTNQIKQREEQQKSLTTEE